MNVKEKRSITFTCLVLISCVFLGSSILTGCGTSKPRAAALETFTPSRQVDLAWSVHATGVISKPWTLIAQGDQVIAADRQGQVLALDIKTGNQRWRTIDKLGAPISAAVGSDGRYTALVTQENELVVFEREKIIWREKMTGQVITAPLVVAERVFVQAVDRSVRAYDVTNGRWLWNFNRQSTEILSLAQQSLLSVYKDTLVVGHGSRLLGLDPVKGTIRFEVSLGQPRGSNEVERLSDLIGPVARVNDILCVRAYQLSVGCVDMSKATLMWSKTQAGQHGVAADANAVVGADNADRLIAWQTSSGEALWRVDRFQYRGISTPIIWSNMVVFVDSEGLLHCLSLQNGRTVARLSLDSMLGSTPVIAADGKLLLQTISGKIYAFKVN